MRLMFQGCPPGPDVRTIQNRLNQAATKPAQASKLPALVPDGIFGGKTAQRVAEFQATNGLVVDGVVGPKTEGVLNDLLGSPTHLTPPHVPPKPAAPMHAPLAGNKAAAKAGPVGLAGNKAVAKAGPVSLHGPGPMLPGAKPA